MKSCNAHESSSPFVLLLKKTNPAGKLHLLTQVFVTVLWEILLTQPSYPYKHCSV